jgi:alpha-beta hydrolase superfamily lysophospholipase
MADSRWALGQIDARFGHLPVGLVGHSMGGRVALRLADHRSLPADRRPGVRAVAALAPWLPDGEPIPVLADRHLLLAHGTADRTTDPVKTAHLAQKLEVAGGDVELVEFAGGRHSMIFPARPWHELVASFMVRTLLAPAPQI